MAVPYTFGSATSSIPLSQLDSNFATTITLGNTAVQLGNTITNLTGVSNVASATSLSLGSNGNTTAITVDTSQNVGVGTTSPSFSGFGSNTGGVQVTNATNASFKLSGNAGGDFYMVSGTGQHWLYATGAVPMVFSTNGLERMRVNAGAPILCLSGGSTSATGTGIAFPATQSASSDANTLDDYEEGTWTPALGSGVTTYATRNGVYTKVGRQVTVYFDISITTTTGTGGLSVSGLPFVQRSASPIASGALSTDALDLPAGTVSLALLGTAGGSSELRLFASLDNAGLQQLQYETGAAWTLYGSCTYFTD